MRSITLCVCFWSCCLCIALMLTCAPSRFNSAENIHNESFEVRLHNHCTPAQCGAEKRKAVMVGIHLCRRLSSRFIELSNSLGCGHNSLAHTHARAHVDRLGRNSLSVPSPSFSRSRARALFLSVSVRVRVSLCVRVSLTLSLSRAHTHTHTLSLSLVLTHTHTHTHTHICIYIYAYVCARAFSRSLVLALYLPLPALSPLKQRLVELEQAPGKGGWAEHRSTASPPRKRSPSFEADARPMLMTLLCSKASSCLQGSACAVLLARVSV